MSHLELEETTRRLREAALAFANRLDGNSTNSSRPPGSDALWSRQGGEKPVAPDGHGKAASSSIGTQPTREGEPSRPAKASGKRPGQQPGAPGHWRRLSFVATGEPIEHRPPICSHCGLALDASREDRMVGAHNVCEIERGEMELRVNARKHCYFRRALRMRP